MSQATQRDMEPGKEKARGGERAKFVHSVFLAMSDSEDDVGPDGEQDMPEDELRATVSETGVISRIELINFMCHRFAEAQSSVLLPTLVSCRTSLRIYI